MFAVAAFISFAIAILMHLFGWQAGKVDVLLFELIGLLCIAGALAWPGWTWRH